MTAKTAAGARTRIAILGFQEFMNRVDADRIKRMPPDTFENFFLTPWLWVSSTTGHKHLTE